MERRGLMEIWGLFDGGLIDRGRNRRGSQWRGGA